ncbi:MAG: hypothetical protein ACRD0J_00515, partial [Acidimicrobiales bacterium]
MSIPVELERLREEIGRRRLPPYLLTTGPDGPPHVVALVMAWDGDSLVSFAAGRRSLANASARTEVSLLWPPSEPGGYSLIVDGTATVEPGGGEPSREPGPARVAVRPTRAVLH